MADWARGQHPSALYTVRDLGNSSSGPFPTIPIYAMPTTGHLFLAILDCCGRVHSERQVGMRILYMPCRGSGKAAETILIFRHVT
jgi:hypothetical protein